MRKIGKKNKLEKTGTMKNEISVKIENDDKKDSKKENNKPKEKHSTTSKTTITLSTTKKRKIHTNDDKNNVSKKLKIIPTTERIQKPNYPFDTKIAQKGFSIYDEKFSLAIQQRYQEEQEKDDGDYYYIIQFGLSFRLFRFYFIPINAHYQNKPILGNDDLTMLIEAMCIGHNYLEDNVKKRAWFEWWERKIMQLLPYSYTINDDEIRYGRFENAKIKSIYFVYPFKNLRQWICDTRKKENEKKELRADHLKIITNTGKATAGQAISQTQNKYVQILSMGDDIEHTSLYFIPLSVISARKNYDKHLKWLTKIQSIPPSNSNDIEALELVKNGERSEEPVEWNKAWKWWYKEDLSIYQCSPLNFSFPITIYTCGHYVFGPDTYNNA